MENINLNMQIYSQEIINEINLAVSKITQIDLKKTQKFYINSQLIKKDSVFIVLQEYTRKPAYEYIENAIENGAKLIITHYCEDKVLTKYTQDKILITKNTLDLLIKVAQYKRYLLALNNNTIFIGITGSTCKNSLNQYFNICSNIYTNEGNLNNHIGMPLSLASVDMNAKIIALELAMNNSGEINYLTNILKPEIAIITNVSEAHIGNLKSIFQTTQEKISIINGLVGQKILILSQDAKYYEYMLNLAIKNKCQVFSFSYKYISEEFSSDCYLLNYRLEYNNQNALKKINTFNTNLNINNKFLDNKNIKISLHDLVTTKAKIIIFGVRINININKYIQKHILSTLLGGILCDIIVTCMQDLKSQNCYEYFYHEHLAFRQYIINYIQRENISETYNIHHFHSFNSNELQNLNNQLQQKSNIKKSIPNTVIQNTIYHSKLEQLINDKLNSYLIENGRGNIIYTKKFFNGQDCIIINDSYNASFASVQASLNAFDLLFSAYQEGLCKQFDIKEDNIEKFNQTLNIKAIDIKNNIRKVLILADMLELGEFSIQLHKNLVDTILNIMPNVVLLYGEHMKHLFNELKSIGYNIICLHFDTLSHLEEYLSEHICDNDFILIKGSKGTNLYKLLEN